MAALTNDCPRDANSLQGFLDSGDRLWGAVLGTSINIKGKKPRFFGKPLGDDFFRRSPITDRLLFADCSAKGSVAFFAPNRRGGTMGESCH